MAFNFGILEKGNDRKKIKTKINIKIKAKLSLVSGSINERIENLSESEMATPAHCAFIFRLNHLP